MAEEPSPFSIVAEGVRIRVRLTPKASRDRIEGLQPDAEGGCFLKVSVTAVPEGGKANAALVKRLAKEWRLPKTSLTVVSGATDRRKTVLAAGNSEDLMHVFTQWMEKWNA